MHNLWEEDRQEAFMHNWHFAKLYIIFTLCVSARNVKQLNSIYVTRLGSGEDPRLQNTLKNASYQGGRAAN